MKKLDWHRLSVEKTLSELSSDCSGLRTPEARRRLAVYGANTLESKKKESPLAMFLGQFKSPLIYILLFAAAISFIVGKIPSGVVILIVLFANATMGFVQESRAKSSMEKLKELSAPKAKVLRDDAAVEISTKDIVPGDIILLESGTKVPADARIMEAVRLQIDEAAFTGESHPVYKIEDAIDEDAVAADRRNMIFSGTVVVSGRGRAVVTAAGMNTEIGAMARMIQDTPQPKTPIQRRLESFGRFIIILVTAQVAAAFVIGFFIRRMNFIDIFFVVLSQMVSSIPEGLPVAVTVALAVGMQRMANRKAYVRKLAAVEGLGSTTVICSDKTGTLTKNEMTTRRIFTFTSSYDVSGTGYAPEGKIIGPEAAGESVAAEPPPDLKKLLLSAVLCNNAALYPSKTRGRPDVSGDPTEIAYLTAAAKAGFDVKQLAADYPRIEELPYEPQIQMMATRHIAPDGRSVVFVKGAPEKILPMCARYLTADGSEKPVGETERAKVLADCDSMALSALRVLAFAYYEDEERAGKSRGATVIDIDNLDGKLVYAGAMGNIDPPREEVKAAIKMCKEAGIKTIMVTGDHLKTAEAIAAELGISQTRNTGVSGSELEKMSAEELSEAVRRSTVFARIEPKHKLWIVQALQRQGEVVAMTGDGINDAPALSASDIGVAMGITGTDVAKEAAGIVIADDNFTTIVNAVEEGRGIASNIRKTVLYLLCSSNTEILLLLTALVTGLQLPLIPVMILWVNLVTDGGMTIPLTMEPRENVMDRPPEKKDAPLVTPRMLNFLFYRVPIMSGGLITLFVYELSTAGSLEYARTAVFTALVITQWFNGISTRSFDKSVFKMDWSSNKYIPFSLGIGFTLHLSLIYVPFLRSIFMTVPLSAGDWFRIIAGASTILWAEELRKFFAARKGQIKTA
ncbi:MAG: HAD-IC family P-type ATPase [Endomicrobiia bacterium]|nr:HAD-IC family P-type ATPase [Endomicrobiia bacterium]